MNAPQRVEDIGGKLWASPRSNQNRPSLFRPQKELPEMR